MTVLQKAGDRMLSMFVPRTAAAADDFTQYCGCLQVHTPCRYHWYRTCAWKPGGGYECLSCYNSWILCTPVMCS